MTKRWIRWRLSTGITVGAVRADVRAITLFAQSFPSLHRGPQAVTREVIEAHLAHLAIRYPAPKTRTSYFDLKNSDWSGVGRFGLTGRVVRRGAGVSFGPVRR